MSEPESPLSAPWSGSDRWTARVLAQPLQRFLDTEASGGAVLLLGAVVALVWANSPWSASYHTFWSTDLDLHLGDAALHGSLQHWVNDLAMALFFFVAGLEIKRELVHGDLRSARTAALPIVAAVGGMVVPALIFFTLNAGTDASHGWGIPMATDIAFSIGVLAIMGRRAPAPLKVFLLTLAIVDDIGAIIVIAVFYSSGVQTVWLVVAVLTVGAIVLLRWLGVRSLVPYVVLAGVLWLAVYDSGVHATIAGVVLGLLTPARPLQDRGAVRRWARQRLDEADGHDDETDEVGETALLDVSTLTAEGVSPLARLERALHPWSAFVVLPLFALANAGVALSSETVGALWTSSVSIGIIVGLVIGKPLGICLAAFGVVKLGIGTLPAHTGWLEILGAGVLAGIGFTVSLFITGLAFTGEQAEDAKLAILVASVIAGALGALLLGLRGTSHPLVPPKEG